MNIYLDEFLPKISTEFLIKSRWNIGKYLDLVSMVEIKNVGHIPSKMVALRRRRLQQLEQRQHQYFRCLLRLQAAPAMPKFWMKIERHHGKNVAVITAVTSAMLAASSSLHRMKCKQHIGWNKVGKLGRKHTWYWPQFRPCNLASMTTTALVCMLLGCQVACPSTSEGNLARCYWAGQWASAPVC